MRILRRNAAREFHDISTTLHALEIEVIDRYRVAHEIEQALAIDLSDDMIFNWQTVEDVLRDVGNTIA
jgi:acyl carrier protein